MRAANLLPLFLVILQCSWIPTIRCQSQQIDLSGSGSVGFTVFKDTKVRVFELEGGIQVAQPIVKFTAKCSSMRYNRLYLRHQLSVPVELYTNTLEKPLDSGKSVGHVTVTGFELQLDAGLASDKSKVTAMMKRGESGSWRLLFLCDTFDRCQDLRDELISHQWALQQAVKFIPIGRVGNTVVRFAALSSSGPLHLTNCYRGDWFIIQRRENGDLSFAKNWDSYVKGFGNPDSNFWIGLESLFAITATKEEDKVWKNSESSLCQMRIEARAHDGKFYWSQYNQFQVMGADKNYRLRIGGEIAGSNITQFIPLHNDREFSTYDKDHDGMVSGSCSQVFGFGGWWYGNCHSMNLNGPFTSKPTNSPVTYESAVTAAGWTQMKTVVMKLKCD